MVSVRKSKITYPLRIQRKQQFKCETKGEPAHKLFIKVLYIAGPQREMHNFYILLFISVGSYVHFERMSDETSKLTTEGRRMFPKTAARAQSCTNIWNRNGKRFVCTIKSCASLIQSLLLLVNDKYVASHIWQMVERQTRKRWKILRNSHVRGDKYHHNLSLFAQTSRSIPTITLGDMFLFHINTSVAVTVAHNWTTIHEQTINTSPANSR